VKSLFFSFEGKRKSEATTKKGFKVSSISHPKHGRGDSNKGEETCLVPLTAQSDAIERPRVAKREGKKKKKKKKKKAQTETVPRAASLSASNKTIVDRENFLSSSFVCFSRHVERERDEPKRALLRPRWLSRGGEKDHFERVRVAERALVAETNARGTSGTFEVRHHARFVRRSSGFTANRIHVRTRGYFQMVAK
tara:strand:+ start:242 stop:826 length:585 start_codon:yes stop_codon:yes gene_type:complete